MNDTGLDQFSKVNFKISLSNQRKLFNVQSYLLVLININASKIISILNKQKTT